MTFAEFFQQFWPGVAAALAVYIAIREDLAMLKTNDKNMREEILPAIRDDVREAKEIANRAMQQRDK